MKVLKRDETTYTITVECPACSTGFVILPSQVTKIADGSEVIGTCPQCRQQIQIDLAALGGHLWEPTPRRKP